MKQCFIFCHGWATDIQFWNNIKNYFSLENINTIYLDLGYFGNSNSNLLEHIQQEKNTQFIGVGHSLGLIKLLSLNIKFKALIGLQSFINFLGNDSQLHKKRKLELILLKQQFNHDPISALKRFYQRASLHVNFNQHNKYNFLNRNLLMQDLNLLSLNCTLDPDIPLLIIAAQDDVIVPPELILDNFSKLSNAVIDMLNIGQHGLGYQCSELIYRKIKSFAYGIN